MSMHRFIKIGYTDIYYLWMFWQLASKLFYKEPSYISI